MHEIKLIETAELKIAGDGAGEFEGRASTFGTIDSYGDTVDKGAFAATIPEFIERGFIGWGHDWADPIGLITAAEERDDGLWITGKFHSDPEAQKYRQRAKERVDAGRFMGLSIGFEAKKSEPREVEGREKPVRALTEIKLYEVSLVAVPAERNSGVSIVKSGPDPALAMAMLEEFDDPETMLPWLEAQLARLTPVSESSAPSLAPELQQLVDRQRYLEERYGV